MIIDRSSFIDKDLLIEFSKNLNSKKYSLQFLPQCMVEISNIKKIEFKNKKLKTSYIIDIIHNLLLKYYFRKENLFNLSSLVLRDKYGVNYNTYFEFLTNIRLIILVKNHRKGGNARIYKLNDIIIKEKIFRYKNYDSILLKKYKKAINEINNKDYFQSNIDIDVKRKLVSDLFNIGIDWDKSICFIDSTKQERDIYNKNKYSIECIKDKHIFYHFDSYGRMHTNFTILKSFIRKNCLKIDDSDTIEFDISNSQPLFLAKIIHESNTRWVNQDEFELFSFLTKTGNFYQYIIDNSDINDKKIVKEMVYKVLFGKNYKNKFDNLFCTLFPTIYNFIKIYKKEGGSYKILSHDLQKMESNVIYNKIIKRIIFINPDIKIITVHDSLICSINHKELVGRIFSEVIESEFLF